MLTSNTIPLPDEQVRFLRSQAAFSESWNTFLREHLSGFRQPVAATAALVGPVLIAFSYAVADFVTMREVALTFGLTTAMFLLGAWYVNRRDIRAAFVRHTAAAQAAKRDLKAGAAEATELDLRAQPAFYEHEHGVVVLADAGQGRTLYFDVDGDGFDPRWFLYVNGDLHRRRWSWLRLGGTGAIRALRAEGVRLADVPDTPYVTAPDAWEAVSLALGEPQDGDVIDMPFGEVRRTVDRLL